VDRKADDEQHGENYEGKAYTDMQNILETCELGYV
jgi:hypothetical protein